MYTLWGDVVYIYHKKVKPIDFLHFISFKLD